MSSSSNSNINAHRAWMYQRLDQDSGELTSQFLCGLEHFITNASMQPIFQESGKIMCTCPVCKNGKLMLAEKVWRHIYRRRFVRDYYVWIYHGEDPQIMAQTLNLSGASTSSNFVVQEPTSRSLYVEEPTYSPYMENMVGDGFPSILEQNTEGVPNNEAKHFFDLMETAKQSIYEGCREGQSRLSLSSRLMGMKTEYNVTENCMDSFCETLREYLPVVNHAPEKYYQTKRTLEDLGMPRQKINVCIRGCMLFWGIEYSKLLHCKFCEHDRFKPKKRSSRLNVSFHKMYYLPLTERLKRLYESNRISPHMRWHAEHALKPREMQHPSDGKAWKDFNRVFPQFAFESRNIYLCCCTYGFSPFGQSGKQYSLLPVILSPYNLPPEMCLKKEFMFMMMLIPGPDHPKKNFDIYLEPLIKELTDLWNIGVTTYDISVKQNFTLKAVLLWTISDFPALGMLSGWSTHGRLTCPYCMEETDSFRLEHGRKPSWFDCHRRFLPLDHPFRRDRNKF